MKQKCWGATCWILFKHTASRAKRILSSDIVWSQIGICVDIPQVYTDTKTFRNVMQKTMLGIIYNNYIPSKIIVFRAMTS